MAAHAAAIGIVPAVRSAHPDAIVKVDALAIPLEGDSHNRESVLDPIVELFLSDLSGERLVCPKVEWMLEGMASYILD
jgi:hypothetical protein